MPPRIIENAREHPLWRVPGIGSGDAPVILGISPFIKLGELWEFKTKRKERPPMNRYMERGLDLEAQARSEVEWILGKSYPAVNLIHARYDWAKAALDGRAPGSFIEIKCPGKKAHDSALAGEVPAYYIPQIDHQYFVDDEATEAFYCSFDPSRNIPDFKLSKVAEKAGVTVHHNGQLVIIPVARDRQRIDELVKLELSFYQCLLDDTAPELTLNDIIFRFDDSWAEAALQYAEACRKVNEAEKEKEESRAKLIELANGKPSMGYGVRLTPYTAKGRTDWESATKELIDITGEPFDLSPFKKPETTSVRITVEE